MLKKYTTVMTKGKLGHYHHFFPRRSFQPILFLGLCILSLSLLTDVQARTGTLSTPTIINATTYTLGFSTYLGGKSVDEGNAIAVDSHGNSYITGDTSSSNFPMKNAYNSTFGGGSDVFVAKFDATGALVFSTYLGGSGNDYGRGIAVDSAGNSYITGSTDSANFPMKNAYNNTYGGSGDVFVAKFDATGTLVFSTYLGGSSEDDGNSIAVDSAGNSYITGNTFSSNFPIKNNINNTYAGGGDVFIAKFDATGGVVFCAYFGGTFEDVGNGIEVDSSGNF